jgi:hypothetical protein
MLKGILILFFGCCVLQLWTAQQPAKLPTWAAGRSVNLGKYFQCPDTSTESYRVGGIDITVTAQQEITLKGRSRLGTAWSVNSSYPGDISCRFYSYDLDRNGINDFIFVIPNAGSGPAGITLLVIAFDSKGLPIPWQGTGPFLLGSNGVENFIDVDGDRRAELLYQYIEEQGRDRTLITQTSLYKITEGEFHASRALAGHVFPVIEPPRIPLPDAPDLTNAKATGRVIKTEGIKSEKVQGRPCWISGIDLGPDGITLPPEANRLECGGYISGGNAKVPLPLMIVHDKYDGTRFVDIDHSIAETSRQIATEHLPVIFAGRSCETGCRPLIMWAAKK